MENRINTKGNPVVFLIFRISSKHLVRSTRFSDDFYFYGHNNLNMLCSLYYAHFIFMRKWLVAHLEQERINFQEHLF